MSVHSDLFSVFMQRTILTPVCWIKDSTILQYTRVEIDNEEVKYLRLITAGLVIRAELFKPAGLKKMFLDAIFNSYQRCLPSV